MRNKEKKRESDRRYRKKNRARVAAWKRGDAQAAQARVRIREWTKKNESHARRRIREWHLKKLYGITIAQYDAMVDKQGGVCRICESLPGKRRLGVDHCHDTGRIRGLLCFKCNAAIGFLNDNPTAVIRLLAYLNGEL